MYYVFKRSDLKIAMHVDVLILKCAASFPGDPLRHVDLFLSLCDKNKYIVFLYVEQACHILKV